MDDTELRDWMRRVEERLDRMERQRVPSIQPTTPTPWKLPDAPIVYPDPTTPPRPPWEQPVISLSSCRVCGLRFDGPMGYVCTRADCPSGVRCTSSAVAS